MSRHLELQVGGFTPMTTVDYPGELSAVIFCQGCPWKCRYCHNSELIPRLGKNPIPWNKIIDFLQQRLGLLDAVVFSGGEPTLQRSLPCAIQQVKALGYKVGLHTAGPYPNRFKALLPSLDWVGLDIKATQESYPKTTGVNSSGYQAWRSAKILIESGVPHEIRTTVHPLLISSAEQKMIAKRLRYLGSAQHQLQTCITDRCLDPTLKSN